MRSRAAESRGGAAQRRIGGAEVRAEAGALGGGTGVFWAGPIGSAGEVSSFRERFGRDDRCRAFPTLAAGGSCRRSGCVKASRFRRRIQHMLHWLPPKSSGKADLRRAESSKWRPGG
jgi:hypothetical protein